MDDIIDIKEFEKLSSGFLDHLPYGICVLDNDANVLFINRRQEQLSAVTRNEVIGKCLLDSPALRENGLDSAIKSVLETGVSWRGAEVEAVYRDDGVQKKEMYRDEIVAVRENGHIVGAMIISVPAYDQEKLNERILQIDQEFDALFQVFQDGLMVIDEDYTILRINKVHASLFGKNALLLAGKKCYSYLRNNESVCENCPAKNTATSKELALTELQLATDGSDDKNIQLYAYPMSVKGDVSQQVMVYSRDMSHALAQKHQIKQFGELLRKEVSQRTAHLRTTNALNNTILDSFDEIVVVISAEYTILKFNRAFQEALHLTNGDITGKNISDVAVGLFNSTMRNAIDEAKKTNDVIEKETPFQIASLPTRWIKTKISPATLSDGTEIIILIAEDITEKKQQKQRIAFREKMESIGLLARKIAHEINNPLEAILNRVCLLEMETEKVDEEDKIREELRAIQTQIDQISEITSSLLVFTKTSSEEFQTVDIAKVLHNAILVADISSSRAEINVTTDIAPDLPKVMGDKHDLERCFVNVLRNAVDAIIDKGRIAINADFDAGSNSLRIVIRDTGVGIAEQNLEHIFDPFYSTKKIGRRVGLGLSITYGIILDHRGSIDVFSTQDEGTTVEIRLPEYAGKKK